jgi:hypothetical protein
MATITTLLLEPKRCEVTAPNCEVQARIETIVSPAAKQMGDSLHHGFCGLGD